PPAGSPSPVPGAGVLPTPRTLAHPRFRQALRFTHNLAERAGNLRTTRIRHHAEGAELVAAFLNRQKCRHTAMAHHAARRLRQMFELVFDRIVGFDDLLACPGTLHHGRKPVIGPWPDHAIDRRPTPEDFPASGLRAAA